MKLFLARLWWFFILPFDIIMLLDLDPFPQKQVNPCDCFFFSERQIDDLRRSWQAAQTVVAVNETRRPGLQYVTVAGLQIAVIVETAPVGYRVSGVEQPNIWGQGVSVTQAKYDFQMSYQSWLVRQGFQHHSSYATCGEENS